MFHFLHTQTVFQIIFRKIADVKREAERQRSEVVLSIPEDHPVRKLFHRFRQQRDSQPPGESNTFFDHNCVQVEPQRHHHNDAHSCPQRQSASSQQQELSSPVHNNTPCTGRGSTSSGSNVAAPQEVFAHAEKSKHSCTQVTVEPKSRPCGEGQICERSNSREAVPEGAAGGVRSSSRSARGWAKFKSATSAVLVRPAVEQEKQPQKAVPWPKASQHLELSAAAKKNQETKEGGHMGSTEGGSTAGETGEETSILHKTDSCDSGITKSDLRIDRAGEPRSSFERSPLERSPLERNLFDHSPGVYTELSLRQSFVQPASEQTVLQAALHEAKLELKGDITKLSSRLSLLESQVSEILRLLSMKRRLSLPPTSSKARIKNQDSVTTTEDERF